MPTIEPRLPFVIDHAPDPILIVSHGSPADPDPQEEAIAALAAQVAALCPGRQIAGATLSKGQRFEEQIAALGRPRIYPFFISNGYFISTVIARRVAPFGVPVLPPFGHAAGLCDMLGHAVAAEMARLGWQPGETALLVAGHGSAVSERNAQTTRALADQLHRDLGLRRTEVGFVEQPPHLPDAAKGLGQAVCLPLFALRAGHYLDDVPEALAGAGFTGPALAPLIEWPGTAALIARDIAPKAMEAAQ